MDAYRKITDNKIKKSTEHKLVKITLKAKKPTEKLLMYWYAHDLSLTRWIHKSIKNIK